MVPDILCLEDAEGFVYFPQSERAKEFFKDYIVNEETGGYEFGFDKTCYLETEYGFSVKRIVKFDS